MQEVKNLIHERYIMRGKKIILEGSVVIDQIKHDNAYAYAIGTSIYRINLFRQNNILFGTCTCPSFIDFGPCKHIAATALALLTPGYRPDNFYTEQKDFFESIINQLTQKNKNELLDLIINSIGKSTELLEIISEEISDI